VEGVIYPQTGARSILRPNNPPGPLNYRWRHSPMYLYPSPFLS
jgi:hypothetical protein